MNIVKIELFIRTNTFDMWYLYKPSVSTCKNVALQQYLENSHKRYSMQAHITMPECASKGHDDS